MLTELRKKKKIVQTKFLSNPETNCYSHHNIGPSQLKLVPFLVFWLPQNPGMKAAFDMLPTACFSSLPTFANSLVLLPQIFLRLSSLYMTFHPEFRNYKVSHHPLRYCYKISVIMTHYAAIAHRVCTHMPICVSELWNHYAFAAPLHLHKY